MKFANIRGAVSHKTETNTLFPFVLCGKCNARRDREVASYNRVTAQKVLFAVENVHRSAFSFGGSRVLSQEFGHDSLWVQPFRDRKAVIPVSGDDIVIRIQCPFDCPGRYRFLAVIQVAKSHDFPHPVQLSAFFFEAADQQHVVIPFEKRLAGHPLKSR